MSLFNRKLRLIRYGVVYFGRTDGVILVPVAKEEASLVDAGYEGDSIIRPIKQKAEQSYFQCA